MAAPIIVAYFAAWSIYSRSYFVADIPGDKITHINYAFANIGSDGRIALGDPWADVDKAFPGDTWDQPLRGNFNQLLKLKEKYPHLRTLISIGGWTWSGKFSDVAVSAESRAKFAESCVNFAKQYGFDGVDLDWEYPVSGGLAGNINRPEDKQNYVLLLKEIRQLLDAAGAEDGKSYLLTVATGAGTERIADMDLPGMTTYLDWINVMTYDFHGGWEAKTGHNAPLYMSNADTSTDVSPSFIKSRYNCDAAIQAYIAAGVPRSKLIMGLGLYGRGWQGVTSTAQNGFSQPASSTLPMGTWENGVFDYDHLKKSYMPTYTRYWDDSSKVPFLFNPSTGIWISYDDLQSIGLKNDYIKQQRLGGAMFWELSSDRNAELVDSTFQALNNGVVPTIKPTQSTVSTTTGKPTQSTVSTATGKPTTIASTSVGPTTTQGPSDVHPWRENVSYNVGDRVTYEGKIYKCLQAHVSLSGWTPATVAALWELV
jgi:chitinase